MANSDQKTVPFSPEAAKVAADPNACHQLFDWLVRSNEPTKTIEVDGPDGKERMRWTTRKPVSSPVSRGR